jgi:hypothetical protein
LGFYQKYILVQKLTISTLAQVRHNSNPTKKFQIYILLGIEPKTSAACEAVTLHLYHSGEQGIEISF